MRAECDLAAVGQDLTLSLAICPDPYAINLVRKSQSANSRSWEGTYEGSIRGRVCEYDGGLRRVDTVPFDGAVLSA